MNGLGALIVATGVVVCVWAILLPAIAGVGLSFRRLGGWRRLDADRVVPTYWLGFAAVTAFLQLWHLAMPFRWPALLIVLVWGAAGWWFCPIEKAQIRAALTMHKAVAVALFVALAMWAADRAIGPVRAYDSGLYHLTAIRWATDFPIVRGLGNLHGRLAFNNSHLLLAAMLEAGPGRGRSGHFLNGLFLLPLLWQIVSSAFDLPNATPRRRLFHVFNVLLLTPALMLLLHREFSSPTTDFGPTVVGLVLASMLLDYLTAGDRSGTGDGAAGRAFDVFTIITLASVAVTMKLSLVAYAGSISVAALGFWLLRDAAPAGLRFRAAAAGGLAAVVLLGTWAYRGVLLSGYPLYPSRAIATVVDWRVPENLADKERDDVGRWARQYFQPHPIGRMTGWPWFKEWVSSLPAKARFEVVVPLAITAVMLAAGLAVWRAVPGGRAIDWRSLAVAIPVLVGIAFWFATAPAPRFASYLFWDLAALAATAAVVPLKNVSGRRLGGGVVVVSLIPAVLFLVHVASMSAGNQTTAPGAFHGLLQTAGQDHGFGGEPAAQVMPFTTDSGLVVNVPTAGDQCWDAKLPCSPYSREFLRLRRSGDLAAGFVLTGPTSR